MRLLYYIALLALPFQVSAEADMDVLALADQSYTDDLPIVLSATRLSQPISEAPVAMTVIDRDMIEASGARNIPDVLRLVPGFQVGYFDGNSPVVTYHGHSGEHNTRLQVLIDGRSVYEPAFNAVPWSDLEVGMDDIEHIEVTRGPNAATYGNNSFFAVISITTRHAVESQGQYVRVRAGSGDTLDATYTFGGQQGDLDYRVTVNTTNDDGTNLLRDETAADGLSYRLDWQLTGEDRIMYQGGYKDILLGDHESVPEESPYTGHSIENISLFQLIKWEHAPSSANSYSLQYYYNRHQYNETSPAMIYDDINNTLVLLGFDPYTYVANLEILSERHDVEFNNILQPGNNLRIVWGASARLDEAGGYLDGGTLFRTARTQQFELYRGYTHGEWEFIPDWLLNAGYMVEYNEISGNDHSPRLTLIHHINNEHTLRISTSKATRTPTVWEEDGELIYRHNLTSNNGGPPASPVPGYQNIKELILTEFSMLGGLQSEKISRTELGYIGQLLNNQLTIDLTVFQDKTSRLITTTEIPTPVPQSTQYDLSYPGEVYTFENALASEIRGLELSIEYRFNKSFRSYLFYSHLALESSGDLTITEAERRIREIAVSAPEDSGGLMLVRNWNNNLDTSLMLYRAEDFDWLDRNNEQSTDGFTKIDMRIAKNWLTAREKVTLTLIGQNLLGTHYDYNQTSYISSGEINRPGSPQDRRLFVELGLKFN
jgi:iron complex outermembrane receptor protein